MLETIGFTEENRYGEVLSHEERKFWIYCFLAQLVYLSIMTLFLICGDSFKDRGRPYSGLKVQTCMIILFLFNGISYIGITGIIVYAKAYA